MEDLYLKELQEAINDRNEHRQMVYLRILTKQMGLEEKDYRRLIKRIYNAQKDNPDLDL